MGKNGCKWTKIREIWGKMGKPIPFERVMGPNRHSMENNGGLQPIARSMNPTLWVPSENLLLASSLKGLINYVDSSLDNLLIAVFYCFHKYDLVIWLLLLKQERMWFKPIKSRLFCWTGGQEQ